MHARNVSTIISMLAAFTGCAPDATDGPSASEVETAPALAQVASPWTRGAVGSLAQRAAGFVPLGGQAESSPAITSWGAGRFDVFVRAADGTLRHLTHEDGDAAWEDLGGTSQGDPAAVSSEEGRIDVFARGSDDALWQKTLEDGAWARWRSLGGSLASGPAAASGAPGEIDVVARSSAGGLVHRQFRDGAWGAWRRLDGNISFDPGIDIDERGSIHLAARATSGTMIYRRFETGWSSWQEVPGGSSAQSGPAVAAGDGKVVGYVRGADSAVWSISYASGRWSALRRLGGSIVYSPRAVHTPGRIDVAVVGADKVVYHRAFTGPTAGTQPSDPDIDPIGDASSAGPRDRPGL